MRLFRSEQVTEEIHDRIISNHEKHKDEEEWTIFTFSSNRRQSSKETRSWQFETGGTFKQALSSRPFFFRMLWILSLLKFKKSLREKKKRGEKNPLRVNKYRKITSSLGIFQAWNFWTLGEYSGGAWFHNCLVLRYILRHLPLVPDGDRMKDKIDVFCCLNANTSMFLHLFFSYITDNAGVHPCLFSSILSYMK